MTWWLWVLVGVIVGVLGVVVWFAVWVLRNFRVFG